MKHVHGNRFFFILALVATLFTAFAYAYIYKLTWRYMAVAAQSERDVSIEQSKDSYTTTLLKNYKSTIVERDRVSKIVIDPENTVRFIEALENIGNDVGAEITISSIESLPPAEGEVEGTVVAHVSSAGSWTSIMRALELSEIMPYDVSLNDVRLNYNAASKGSSRNAWQASYTVSVHSISADQNITN